MIMGTSILGIGNLLLKDEGVGCHVVTTLEEMSLPGVNIIDGGTCPDVVQSIEETDKLIVVDAVKGGGMPGQIYKFTLDDVSMEQKPLLSLHDFDWVNNLMIMKHLKELGETIVIGIEPKDIEWGLELSPELQEKIPRIIELILTELNQSINPTKGEVKC